MTNIEIVLRSDYLNGSGDDFRMSFSFGDQEENEIWITSINMKDESQHNFAVTKEDYLFLREQFDKYFKVSNE